MPNVFVLKSADGKPLKLDTAADLEPHIADLRPNEDVEEIQLSGNTLGIEACRALAGILRTRKNLKIFNAADIFTGRLISEIPEALTALLNAILALPHVHTVDLSDNAFGGRLAEPLRDFYSKAGPLRHLLLNNNGLGPEGGSIVAGSIKELAAIKASDPSFPPLETVICGRNRLENGSMGSWAEAYAAHKTLKTVKMTQNGIRPEGIVLLLRDGLAHCTGLEILDLQDNTFTTTGAKALADVVKGWEKIVELGVSDCLLSARGGVLLGEALQQQKNALLKTLRLQYNEIDLGGFKAIARAITSENTLPILEILEMNGNRFSEEELIVDELREFFSDRGVPGLDELDEMEEESEDEAEDEHEVQEVQEKDDRTKPEEADKMAGRSVLQDQGKKIDDLADLLGGAKISS